MQCQYTPDGSSNLSVLINLPTIAIMGIFDWFVLNQIEKVMRRSPKTTLPTTFDGPRSLDEWYYDFTKWIWALDPCFVHYINGLIDYNGVLEELRIRYRKMDRTSYITLFKQIIACLDHVILGTVSRKYKRKMKPGEPLESLRLILQYGKEDDAAREVSRLRLFARCIRTPDYRRYFAIHGQVYPTTIIVYVLINPKNYSDEELKKIYITAREESIEEEFKKADESRRFSDLDNVEDNFVRIVHESLEIRDVKKGKGGDGRRRQKKKKKSAVKRTTKGGSSHTTKRLDQ